MKKLIFVTVFIFLVVLVVNGQNIITKIVVDSETGLPVYGAHVYKLDNLNTGTITNKDGKFVLKYTKVDDTIVISHISYDYLKIQINSLKSDTLMLFKKNIILPEITVKNISGRTILEKVIDSLVSNYAVENLMYNSYVRCFNYEQDSSELFVLSEYLINVYQNGTNNSQYQIIKMRAKPFSITGEKYFEDMRVISGIGNSYLNLFQIPYGFLKKRKLKKYDVKIIDEDNKVFKIKIMNEKRFTSRILTIDKASYAIKKMVSYYSEFKGRSEIGFKQVKNKWYPDYRIVMYHTDLFSKWKHNSKAIKEVIVIYNIDNKTKYIKTNFKSFINIIAEPIKYHIGDWNNDFWENYNYIPLPDWIKQEIEKVNSR